MSAFASDYILQQFGGIDAVRQQVHSSRVWLARTVLSQIAAGDRSATAQLSHTQLTQVQEALLVVELRALDMMQEWRRDARSEDGHEFRGLCSSAFDLRRALPAPLDPDDSIKHHLLLACQAVLGDRGADIRRYLLQTSTWNETAPVEERQSWAERVFRTTADAFLRLVRKQGWSDLEGVAHAIGSLREQQKQLEKEYLKKENGIQQTAALELVSFYHLAKACELLGTYIGTGEPSSAADEVEFHAVRAVRAADAAGIVELALLLRWIGAAARALIRATIWHQLAAYNDRISQFKKALVSHDNARPMFELLPPQRDAMQDLMNIGNRALVVEMPTSSGKTLLAEFRIIQTKVNVAESWVAYLVPTRALVNQVTARLRRDLGRLGINVELASPAIEVDIFEDELLTSTDAFDVLVTTPEKLDLLIRSQRVDLRQRTLGLVIVDEAHNLGDGERGLRAELLLATVNRESPETHFLLMTPFVPNADELAKWLDDERSKSIRPSLAVDWQPNDRVVGLAYLTGAGRNWGISLRSMHTSRPSIYFEGEAVLEPRRDRSAAVSQARSSKKKVAAEIARALCDSERSRCHGQSGAARNCSIVLAYSPSDTWDIAQTIADSQPEATSMSPKVRLVHGFAEAEYGPGFQLGELLKKGIGVHHAGVSPETRYLLEWLVENNELSALVATSTLAQGVNFPVSSVILATHHKAKAVGGGWVKEPLRPDEFWNMAGRAGRLFQDTLGLVLFASTTTEDHDIEKFVDDSVRALTSALEAMIEDTMAKGWELDLRRLVRNDAKWSSFVQFLSHTYRLINDHSRFLADTEMLLRRTYAYRHLETSKPEVAEQLLEATRSYAEQLRDLPAGVAALVDTTGFSPETVIDLLHVKQQMQLPPGEWSPSQLFRLGGSGLVDLVGRMLEIPELSIEGRGPGEPGGLAGIISMWVGGRSLHDIAEAHFTDESDESKRLTECCRLIFQKLAQNASWGLGALQSLSGVDIGSLSLEQQDAFRTLPAMVYYGCSTVEAVLMRSLGVPRSVCVPLGEAFGSASGSAATKGTRLERARHWLRDAPLEVWAQAAGSGALTGQDHRNLWLVLNGHDPQF